MFVDLLLEYNQMINLVSRQSTRESLSILLAESLLLKKYISTSFVIDAGSGSGLLGIPLAIAFPEKKFVLIETIGKKVRFLKEAKSKLNLTNAIIFEGPIQDFMRHQGRFDSTLIARGFPRVEVLTDYVYKKHLRQLLLITSIDRIKKIQNKVANIHQNLYNIPLRNNLIIYKLENVSRETYKKWVK